MAVMPNVAEMAPTSAGEPPARLGGQAARLVLVAVSLVLLVAFALTLLLVENRWAPLLRVDRGANDGLHRYAVTHQGFVAAMRLISGLGSGVAWVVVLTPVVAWLFWRGIPRLAAFVVVTVLGSALLNVVVKTAVHRLRPVLSDPVAWAHGLSFPSAHAQAAIVGYTMLLLVFLPILHGSWRRVAVALAGLAVLAIGFSRIALSVHYVSDVVGGYLLGAAWVGAMTAAFNVMSVNRERRAQVRSGRSAAASQSFDSKPGR
jgi:membrane-associated phospholipid phosphatase